MSKSHALLFVASATMSISACIVDEDPELGTSDEGIINGGPPIRSHDTGHVYLMMAGTTGIQPCSGELITNQWVLTAKHCTYDGDTDLVPHLPSEISVRMGESPDPVQLSSGVREIIRHPIYDAALLRLNDPFGMNGRTSGFERQVGVWTPQALDYQTVEAFGWGITDSAGNGFGELRHEDFVVDRRTPLTAWNYALPMNNNQRVLAAGDSGGGSFRQGVLVGIHQAADDRRFPTVSFDLSTGAIYDWLRANIERFGAVEPPTIQWCEREEECLSADVTGDGIADLVALRGDSTAYPDAWGDVWFAPGTGSGWGNGWLAHGQMCFHGSVCRLGDVDGDGDLDLVQFWRSAHPYLVGYVLVAPWEGSSFGTPRVWHRYFCVGDEECEVGDVDGDGKADLVAFVKTGARAGDVWVSRSDGTTFLGSDKRLTQFCQGASAECAVADVTGDGAADLLWMRRLAQGLPYAGQVEVAIAHPEWNGVFARDGAWVTDFCYDGELCRVGDVDGDRRADLVSFPRDTRAGEEGDAYVAHNHEGFVFYPRFKWHDDVARGAQIPQVADADGDDRADVVVFNHENWPNAHVSMARSRM